MLSPHIFFGLLLLFPATAPCTIFLRITCPNHRNFLFSQLLIYLRKATVTPDRTITGSYDWLRLDQGATDRQFLLRSPVVVAYRDRFLRDITNDWRISMAISIAGNRATSGSDQQLMYYQSWWPATDGTINRSLHPAPIVRAIVAYCDGAYDQSWYPNTDGKINRGMQRSIARSIERSIVASTTDHTIIRCYLRLIVRSFVVPNDLASQVTRFEHDHRPCCHWFATWDHPRFVYDSKLFWSQLRRNHIWSASFSILVVSPVWLGLNMTYDLAATVFALAITHDLCDQSYVLSTIWSRFQHFSVAGRS